MYTLQTSGQEIPLMKFQIYESEKKIVFYFHYYLNFTKLLQRKENLKYVTQSLLKYLDLAQQNIREVYDTSKLIVINLLKGRENK